MSWENFYLATFLVGFLLSALSFFAGAIHLPHFHGHGHGRVGGKGGVSPLNFGTIAAFLCWFGGTGYLLERHSNVFAFLALMISMSSGIGGAALIFWCLWKLNAKEQPLDPADYDMIGVLGKLSIPIREGGTGEIVFSQEGVRRVSGARSDDGTAIGKGTEVVVQRYEKGIAYVRRWEDMEQESEDRSRKTEVGSRKTEELGSL
jgi:membrane protein implicated in regulation of membrane protease activity